MEKHPVVSSAEWLAARQRLLAKEKELTRQRDALTRERQALPWLRIDKDYVFEGPRGRQSLAELFGARSQLVVYHFMLGPDWDAGCKSCSLIADDIEGLPIHLAHRDVAFTAISRAPLAQIEAYKKRMGWSFDWVSSFGTDFNFDMGVSFTPEQLAKGEVTYNFAPMKITSSEMPGLSVFAKDQGAVYRTYSCYSRGLDTLMGVYQLLDLVPKARDEDGLDFSMTWVRRHDEYEK